MIASIILNSSQSKFKGKLVQVHFPLMLYIHDTQVKSLIVGVGFDIAPLE